jgi:hypothetical protein
MKVTYVPINNVKLNFMTQIPFTQAKPSLKVFQFELNRMSISVNCHLLAFPNCFLSYEP